MHREPGRMPPVPGRLLVRPLSAIAIALLLASSGAAEASAAACGIRSPAVFLDSQTGNAIFFQKTVERGDTLQFDTNDNRTLEPTTVHIRFVGSHFSFYARGDNYTIAGQGNLQTGAFGGSLVERKIVREPRPDGGFKTHTQRTVRSLVTMTSKSQWVPCPPKTRS